jgi:RNA polymerase sigma factor (sigma-70 family)
MQERIIHRARLGDQRAFQQLVEDYNDIVWRTARVLLPDNIPAEDSIQEAWIDTWRSFSRFKEGQPFRPWLLAIVANRCRMTMRRRHIPVVPIEDADEDRLISADDVIKEILNLERDSELQSMLITLSTEQQRLLKLRFFAELELTEIAQIMCIPVGTVKSRLHRTLSTLRTSSQVKSLTSLDVERMA